MNNKTSELSALGKALKQNKMARVLEIAAVLAVAFVIIAFILPFAGKNPIQRQSIIWLANIVMLFLVWLGLKLRGQGWEHFGLSSKYINLRSFLFSFLVFIAAVCAFVIGSIIMANITGIPESADMSQYNYLQGNLPMLLAALLAIFIVSSFGEEVIYRGFLITRISEFGGDTKKWLYTAVIISSIIFGLVHFEWGIMGIIQTAFMGLALAIAFILLKRNLIVLIFAHAYMDAILMIQMYLSGN